MDECATCCEKFNLTNHKKIECPFCDFTTCRTCVQTYITSTSNDAHCMACKKVWNRELLQGMCTQKFISKDYKVHRETILLERERCLLPEAQEQVVRVKQRRQLVKLIDDTEKEMDRQRRLQNELHANLRRLDNGYSLEEYKKAPFVRKCPVEGCRGFLSTKWKCEICDNNICPECNEVKDEGHVCDPANVESVKLLKKDTKPCPKCGTMIFKISGCDQMWCPDCHTAFSWKTGVIETGVVHNPHYYDFQRRGGTTAGRNLGDIPCGGLPDVRELYRSIGNDDIMFKIHRVVTHIMYHELNYYRYAEPNNMDLRVAYLMNELDEDDWKKQLQTREKHFEKYRDFHNILTMFSNVSADILRQLVVKELTREKTYETMEELRKYTNGVFKTIMKRYNCTGPYILENWLYCSSKVRYDKTFGDNV